MYQSPSSACAANEARSNAARGSSVSSLAMSPNFVGNQACNAGLLVPMNCEMNHKLSKEYVQKTIVMSNLAPMLAFRY